jgi:hypothetical protein
MEEASAQGDIAAVKDIYDKLVPNTDGELNSEGNHTPEVQAVIRKSAYSACANGHGDVLRFLHEKGRLDIETMVDAVCRSERPDLFSVLIDVGWDINSKSLELDRQYRRERTALQLVPTQSTLHGSY